MPQQSNRKRKLVAFFVAMAVVIATPLAVIASDVFTDVPDDNVFHDDITWLANANVTKGCNPPDNTEFCPGDNVTREQMSAFMRRLAQYLGAEDGTPAEADNAATVGGLAPGEIVQGFADSQGPGETLLTGVDTLEEIEVQVPADGYLQVIGSASFVDADGGTLLMWLQLDNADCDNTVANIRSVGFGYGSAAGIAADSVANGAFGEGTVAVTAGTHTLTLCGNYYLGGPGSMYSRSISATYLDNATVSVGLSGSSSEPMPGAK